MTYEISTTGSADTQELAVVLAKSLQGGDVLELASDLGGGKTTFVQGLARGLGFDGPVTSPTFTLSQVYRVRPQLELHHYDFYRLGQSGVVGDELVESLHDPQVITVVEWPGIVESDLPADRLTIEFEVTGDTTRRLKFRSGGPRSQQAVKQLRSAQGGQA